MSSTTEIETKLQSNKPKIKENLKQRAYLNSVTSFIDYGTRLVTSFVVTPFLLSGLGSTLFGVWQMLGQFTSYASIGDIRASEVLKWAVAQDRDKKSGEELRQYVTATFLLIVIILPFLLIIGAILSWYSPVITNVSPEFYSLVRITSSILVLALIINKVFSIFESILRGMNLGFKRMGIRATIILIGGGLKITAIIYGFGLIALALIQVLIGLVIGITIYLIVKSNVPWFGFGKIDFKKSLSFLKISGWFMGWTGTRLLLFNTDKVILGYLMGPVIVTQYVITKYLINAIEGIVQNVVHGVIPGIGKLYGNKEFDKLLKVRRHMMLLTWILVVNIGSIIILFNESFIRIWIGNSEFSGQIVNLLILLTVIQSIFIQNDSVIINTTMEISHKVYIGLSSAVISIFFMILLTPKYGIIGLCIGMMMGRLVMSIGYPWLIYLKTGNTINFSIIPTRPLIVLIILWGLIYWISSIIQIYSWSLLIISVLISIVILLPFVIFIGISKTNRDELSLYTKKIKIFHKE